MPFSTTPAHFIRTTTVLTVGALARTGCASASETTAAPAAETSAQQPLTIEQPWVKARTTGGMTSAFATLVNDSDESVVLTGTTTEGVAGTTELHETVLDPNTGSTLMQAMTEPVTIASGQSYTLEPGGEHLMLMDLQCGLHPGEELEIPLQFESGAEQTYAAAIKDYAGAQEEYAPSQQEQQNHQAPGHTTASTAPDLPSCHE